MNIQEFRNRMKTKAAGNVDFLNWKKDGKGVLRFVVHPKGQIGERSFIRYEREVVQEDGSKDIWGARRPYEGNDDFSKRFKEWLKSDDSIDNDDVVFKLVATKHGEKTYSKGDLLGFSQDQDLAKKYSWKKNMLRPQTEFLVCARNYDDWDAGWQALILTPGAGQKWWKVVESQIEEYGEEKGDYTKTPQIFKITFDQSLPAAQMYSVERIFHDIDESMFPAFEEDPVDIEAQCTGDVYNPDGGTAEDLVKAMIQVPCPLFDNVVREPVEEKIEEPKPVAASKLVIPPSLFMKGEKYVYDDEVVTYVKEKGNSFIFVDEDSLKVKVPTSDAGDVRPFVEEKNDDPVEQFAEETVKVDAGIKVKDCEKGLEYYTFEGVVIEFVRYQNSKNKGIFKTPEGERVMLDGDDYVSPGSVTDEDDPLAPVAVREEPAVETPVEPEDSSVDEDICSVCDTKVPADAKVCPNCGAVFAVDEDDIPDFGI